MSSRLRIAVAVTAALTTLSIPGAALASGAKDSDRDGMPDKYEKANGLNPRKNDARADKDHDGLPNLAEFRAGTDPRKADTDGDGIRDGDDKRPKFKDGPKVKFPVSSYDVSSGALVMAYGKGSSLTVVVTDDTELEWKGKGCASPATVANLVAGVGVAELKLARKAPSSSPDSSDSSAPDSSAPDDHGHHGRGVTPSGDSTPVADEIGLVCASGS
ncbi:hypothetical protein KOI35_03455 [Actinoplanes bogorensis]|uniref:Uncharacterized protein n=1 Tax=Paractinoplanes bogorensis TaxID=1610840 RepID=A0ABS5YII4_9ACTN|nr:hypothetical protein [Actinoplanes bogorensis]MBU2662553.1 hypothetical protein [Actinoplanes bogorensis]